MKESRRRIHDNWQEANAALSALEEIRNRINDENTGVIWPGIAPNEGETSWRGKDCLENLIQVLKKNREGHFEKNCCLGCGTAYGVCSELEASAETSLPECSSCTSLLKGAAEIRCAYTLYQAQDPRIGKGYWELLYPSLGAYEGKSYRQANSANELLVLLSIVHRGECFPFYHATVDHYCEFQKAVLLDENASDIESNALKLFNVLNLFTQQYCRDRNVIGDSETNIIRRLYVLLLLMEHIVLDSREWASETAIEKDLRAQYAGLLTRLHGLRGLVKPYEHHFFRGTLKDRRNTKVVVSRADFHFSARICEICRECSVFGLFGCSSCERLVCSGCVSRSFTVKDSDSDAIERKASLVCDFCRTGTVDCEILPCLDVKALQASLEVSKEAGRLKSLQESMKALTEKSKKRKLLTYVQREAQDIVEESHVSCPRCGLRVYACALVSCSQFSVLETAFGRALATGWR